MPQHNNNNKRSSTVVSLEVDQDDLDQLEQFSPIPEVNASLKVAAQEPGRLTGRELISVAGSLLRRGCEDIKFAESAAKVAMVIIEVRGGQNKN